MKRLLKICALGVACVCLIASIGGIWAYFADSADVEVKTQTGLVSIGLELLSEDKANPGSYTAFVPSDRVAPGDEINETARIKNNGIDCYIRAKVEFTEQVQELGNLGIYDAINYDSAKWTLAQDGYLYYKEVLKEGAEPAVIFTKLSIPAAVTNASADKGFATKITVDAVQAANFTQDTSSADPWGGITPMASAVR